MSMLQRNNVRVSGAGAQPMPFAHGFGGDQRLVGRVSELLAARGQG